MFSKMRRSETILYVEDDVVTQTAYRDLLQRAGFTVRTASNGLDGLKALRQSPPDLLLLDLLLPRFTGEEVLKFMAEDSSLRPIPVVVLSTNSVVDLNNEGVIGTTQFHLLKHACTPEQLLQVLNKVLENAAAQEKGHAVSEDVADSQPRVTLNGEDPGPMKKPDDVCDPVSTEILELKKQPHVVCAWTNRIKVGGQWMNIGDFLSKRLHLTVTHGVSPDAMQAIMKEARAK